MMIVKSLSKPNVPEIVFAVAMVTIVGGVYLLTSLGWALIVAGLMMVALSLVGHDDQKE